MLLPFVWMPRTLHVFEFQTLRACFDDTPRAPNHSESYAAVPSTRRARSAASSRATRRRSRATTRAASRRRRAVVVVVFVVVVIPDVPLDARPVGDARSYASREHGPDNRRASSNPTSVSCLFSVSSAQLSAARRRKRRKQHEDKEAARQRAAAGGMGADGSFLHDDDDDDDDGGGGGGASGGANDTAATMMRRGIRPGEAHVREVSPHASFCCCFTQFVVVGGVLTTQRSHPPRNNNQSRRGRGLPARRRPARGRARDDTRRVAPRQVLIRRPARRDQDGRVPGVCEQRRRRRGLLAIHVLDRAGELASCS